jgi:hypothetical protein
MAPKKGRRAPLRLIVKVDETAPAVDLPSVRGLLARWAVRAWKRAQASQTDLTAPGDQPAPRRSAQRGGGQERTLSHSKKSTRGRRLRLRVKVDPNAPPVDLQRLRQHVIGMGVEQWKRERAEKRAEGPAVPRPPE